LSLMLQNFPAHYHDPAFREDALRGIGKSVHHINDLIRRLTLLRQELAIKPAEADLNQIVAKALEGFEGTQHVQLGRELQPLPKHEKKWDWHRHVPEQNDRGSPSWEDRS